MAEAGGTNQDISVKLPARDQTLVGIDTFDWLYRPEPDGSRCGKVDLYYHGKGMGGSSAINGIVCVLGAPSDFDDAFFALESEDGE